MLRNELGQSLPRHRNPDQEHAGFMIPGADLDDVQAQPVPHPLGSTPLRVGGWTRSAQRPATTSSHPTPPSYSVSKETISRVTDKVIEEMNDWAVRPREGHRYGGEIGIAPEIKHPTYPRADVPGSHGPGHARGAVPVRGVVVAALASGMWRRTGRSHRCATRSRCPGSPAPARPASSGSPPTAAARARVNSNG
jgi:hypothetical protein